jgi:peptidoglycan/LPS O-acetylase OafA/YrhL
LSAATPAHTTAYRADIDGLRAIAVLGVVLYHVESQWIPGGFTGVDVFFVISGYLIHSLILGAMQANRFSLANFYARRIRRIFPALVFVLLTCWAFGWVSLMSDEYSQLGKHIGASAVFIANFVLNREAGYFDTDALLKPLLHLWSLSVEEQFYLIFPVMLMVLARLRISFGRVFLALFVLSFVASCWMSLNAQTAAYYLPWSRFWELLAGAMLAQGARHLKPGEDFPAWLARLSGWRHLSHAQLWSLLGAVLVACGFLFVQRQSVFPGPYALLPVAGTCLLIAAGPRAGFNRHLLSWPPLVALGLVSYAWYLWHYPLLAFLRITEPQPPAVWQLLGVVGIALLLAVFSYRMLERPIRRNTTARVLTGLIVSMVIAGALGKYTKNVHGFEDRLPRAPEIATMTPNEHAASANATMAILGDSHANHFSVGLYAYAKKHGDGVRVYSYGGCAPIYGADIVGGPGGKCKDLVTPAIDEIAASSALRMVVIAFNGTGYMNSARGVTLSHPNLPSADNNTVFSAGLRATLAKLTAAGKQVVLLTDNPPLNFHPRNCLMARVFSSQPARPHCAAERSWVDSTTQQYRDILYGAAREFSGVRVFDTYPVLCDALYCYAKKDTHLLYADTTHLTREGSLRFAGRFDFYPEH